VGMCGVSKHITVIFIIKMNDDDDDDDDDDDIANVSLMSDVK